LLLESQLIKQHKPKYNILLKDDKGYPFVRLGNEPYARFEVVNRKLRDKARYFGPFSSRGQAYKALDLVHTIFQMPTCTRVFPRDFGKARPCLNYHMEKCMGVCKGDISAEQYAEFLDKAGRILDGKYEGLAEEFEEKMLKASEDLEFEKAASYRDKIITLKKMSQGQGVFSKSLVDTDIVAYATLNMRACVVKMSYIAGTLLDKEAVFFDGCDENDANEVMESFIKQYYEAQGFAPKNIILSHELDLDALSEYVSHVANRKVNMAVPQKGEKRFQVTLALDNARKELELREKLGEKHLKSMEMLTEMLGFEPKRIESYDISHYAGDMTVCGMVVFENGKPLKKAYKRFKIEKARGGDDYASLQEAVGRRLDRALNGDESFLPLPDLFLIDGGLGQVHAIEKVFKEKRIDIPLLGMVKDDKHRTRELIDADGNLFGIDTKPPVFAFITRIQDEVHRFSIEYNKTLRSKKLTKSTLDNIDGIGDERKAKLLRHFKTITAIKNASISELSEIIPEKIAYNVYAYFHKED
ncbi:MAG: excinuclease ABC subunit UvrC, partial [Ruminococcaceae bacterium]|nr:excinuclease ABC subunit UvrC [Oscillospiraceae bacterium]